MIGILTFNLLGLKISSYIYAVNDSVLSDAVLMTLAYLNSSHQEASIRFAQNCGHKDFCILQIHVRHPGKAGALASCAENCVVENRVRIRLSAACFTYATHLGTEIVIMNK